MKNITLTSLRTLSITIRRNYSTSNKTNSIVPLLSTTILTKLHRLNLMTWKNGINNFIWPKECLLKHLTIGRQITSKQICTILSQLTSLQTLVLQNAMVDNIDEIHSLLSETSPNTSLTSLIFTNSQLQMNELQLLLCLTPNLVHLQLISSASSSDELLNGSKWEDFIQTNLKSLKKFEFFFRSQMNNDQSLNEVDSWVIPFRTSFWLDYKSWFVTCDFIPKTKTLRLYTIPICDSLITYESDFDKITATACITIDNSNVKMNRVRELDLNITLLSSTLMKQTIELRHDYLFENLTELTLLITEDWSLNSVEYLSTLINLSKINALAFHIEFEHSSVTNTINNIYDLLQRSNKVQSLTLANSSQSKLVKKIAINLCSRLPDHVKHLAISDMTLADMKQILINAKYVSSVTFLLSYNISFNPMGIVQWLSKRRYFTYLLEPSSLSLWLGDMIDMAQNSKLPSINFDDYIS